MSGIAVFKSDQEGFIEQTEPQLQQLVSEYDLDVCNESFEIDQSGTVQEDEEGKVA